MYPKVGYITCHCSIASKNGYFRQPNKELWFPYMDLRVYTLCYIAYVWLILHVNDVIHHQKSDM